MGPGRSRHALALRATALPAPLPLLSHDLRLWVLPPGRLSWTVLQPAHYSHLPAHGPACTAFHLPSCAPRSTPLARCKWTRHSGEGHGVGPIQWRPRGRGCCAQLCSRSSRATLPRSEPTQPLLLVDAAGRWLAPPAWPPRWRATAGTLLFDNRRFIFIPHRHATKG